MKQHKSHPNLIAEVEAAQEKVTVGAKYRHFKNPNRIYIVTGLGFTESNDELNVIYQSETDERLVFIRPLSSWIEQVEWKGQTLPRFEQVT